MRELTESRDQTAIERPLAAAHEGWREWAEELRAKRFAFGNRKVRPNLSLDGVRSVNEAAHMGQSDAGRHAAGLG